MQKTHSALVKMQLLVGDLTLEIAQMGPDFLILDQPASLPPTKAEIHMQVDDNHHRWFVYLPDGASESDTEVRLSNP